MHVCARQNGKCRTGRELAENERARFREIAQDSARLREILHDSAPTGPHWRQLGRFGRIPADAAANQDPPPTRVGRERSGRIRDVSARLAGRCWGRPGASAAGGWRP